MSAMDTLTDKPRSQLFGGRRAGDLAALIVALVFSAVVGASVSRSPETAATVLFGAPAFILVLIPKYRFASLYLIFLMAPFAAYIKAFTGSRYAPAVLDADLILLVLLTAADRLRDRSAALDGGVLLASSFLLLGALQLFNPLGPGLAVAVYGYAFLILPVTGLLLGRWLVTEPKDVKAFASVLTIAGVAVALYGVHQTFGLNEYDERILANTVGSNIQFYAGGIQRVFSTMSSPIHLAYFMAVLILLLTARIVTTEAPWWTLPLIALFTITLFITVFRTSWIGVIAGIVTIGFAGQTAAPRRIRPIAMVLLATSILSGLAILGARGVFPDSEMTRRVLSLVDPTNDPHFTDRVTSWSAAILPAIAQSPLGYGVGSDSTAIGSVVFSHNGFFYLAVELGLPGLLLAVCLLIWAFRQELALLRHQSDIVRWTTLWGLAWLVTTLVQGTFGPLLEVFPVNLFMWFLIGAHAAIRKLKLSPLSETSLLDSSDIGARARPAAPSSICAR